jgi:hypothetical protein
MAETGMRKLEGSWRSFLSLDLWVVAGSLNSTWKLRLDTNRKTFPLQSLLIKSGSEISPRKSLLMSFFTSSLL